MQAMDAMADEDEVLASRLLQNVIDQAKLGMSGNADDADLYLAWARALRWMDEPEQALLRIESALGLKPDWEPALWELASTLLHDLDRPEGALTLLDTKLIPKNSSEELYRDAHAQASLRIRALHSPPMPPDVGPDGEDMPGESDQNGIKEA